MKTIHKGYGIKGCEGRRLQGSLIWGMWVVNGKGKCRRRRESDNAGYQQMVLQMELIAKESNKRRGKLRRHDMRWKE